MKWLLSCLGVFILVVLGCLVVAFWAGGVGIALWASFWDDFMNTYGVAPGM